MKRALSLVGILALGTAVAGCFGGPGGPGGGLADNNGNSPGSISQGGPEPVTEPGKYGGTLTTSSISSPKTFNPLLAAETSSTEILDELFLPLNTLNYHTLEWEPRLAERPEISEDGLTYTYRLREGLKWSDGHPLTTDDVEFTMKVIYDPKIETPLREGKLIDVVQPDGSLKREQFKVTKVDDRTIQFTLPVKFAPADTVFAFPIIPKHKLESAYNAGRYNSTWTVSTPISQLVSSGAWVISEYVTDQRVVFSRNPHSWMTSDDGKPLPYLDKWVTLIVPDLNATILKFRNGDTDVTGVPQSEYPSIAEGEENGDYRVVNTGPGWGFNYLGFNLNPTSGVDKNLIALFQDVRFRRAASHAVNRQRMVDEIFRGLARPLYGPVSPANSQFYFEDVPKYEYDLEKAKALLDEMGVKDTNGNGFRDYRGKEVKFNILTNNSNELRKSMATIVTYDLKQIGLNAQFSPIDFNALVGRLDAKPYNWEATILGFTGGPEPYAGSNIWRSSAPQHQWWPKQTKPATEWEAEIDQLWSQGAQELDPVKRKAIYDRWQTIVGEQQPFIFTVVTDIIYAARKRLGNMKPTSLGAVWNAEEIFDRQATRDQP
ncbi:MAG: ABC transporter substrate-binding protein [Armatimonadota bacterium]